MIKDKMKKNQKKRVKISKSLMFILIFFFIILISLVVIFSTRPINLFSMNLLNLSFYSNSTRFNELNNSFVDSTDNSSNNSIYNRLAFDNGPLKLYFCNYNNCSAGLIKTINSSENISCAFYDINLKPLVSILEKKNTDLIFDIQLEQDILLENITNKKFMRNSGVMHNKFCILDNNTVLTGSMNPTKFGTRRNNNNFIVIKSEILKNNYLAEFEYLKYGTTPNITKYFIHDNYIIENYFLPHDSTINRIVDLIHQAKYSVVVAIFSFTSKDIADALISAQDNQVDVRIVMESKSKNGLGSVFNYLQESGVEIYEDSNKGNMHHKFIVIDEEVVIVGSPNFSNNGFNKNSENLLIIHNQDISSAYYEEFNRLIS